MLYLAPDCTDNGRPFPTADLERPSGFPTSNVDGRLKFSMEGRAELAYAGKRSDGWGGLPGFAFNTGGEGA